MAGWSRAIVSLSVVSEPSESGVGQMLNQCPKNERIKKETLFLQILPAFLEWCGLEKGGQNIPAGCWAECLPLCSGQEAHWAGFLPAESGNSLTLMSHRQAGHFCRATENRGGDS